MVSLSYKAFVVGLTTPSFVADLCNLTLMSFFQITKIQTNLLFLCQRSRKRARLLQLASRVLGAPVTVLLPDTDCCRALEPTYCWLTLSVG